MPMGGCILGQTPGYAGTGMGAGSLAKPMAGIGKGLYPGACKFVGYNALASKGMCLGLGLGLGAWGPLLLVGAGVAAGYFFFKGRNISNKDEAGSEV